MKSFTVGLIALIMISYIIQNEGVSVGVNNKKMNEKKITMTSTEYNIL